MYDRMTFLLGRFRFVLDLCGGHISGYYVDITMGLLGFFEMNRLYISDLIGGKVHIRISSIYPSIYSHGVRYNGVT